MSAENEIQKNIQLITQKMAAACDSSNRNLSDVRLIAVSKRVPADRIRAAFQAGLKDFGENYVQEALTKMTELSDLPIRWHLIGALQSNKVKQIFDRFVLIHSIERLSTLNQISSRSQGTQEVLVEVNLAAEATKSGVLEKDLPQFLEAALKLENVLLRGFMFMPPEDLDESEQRRYFSRARNLRDQMMTRISGPHNLSQLSMGTSHDFEAAIQEGATLIRIGTAIFGRRA